MGPDYILVNLSVDFVDSVDAGRIETVVAELTRAMKERFPRIQRVFIEAEARRVPPGN